MFIVIQARFVTLSLSNGAALNIDLVQIMVRFVLLSGASYCVRVIFYWFIEPARSQFVRIGKWRMVGCDFLKF